MGWLSALRLRRFLTAKEREQIAAALVEAGRQTRARIALSIEDRVSPDPQTRAQALLDQWDLPQGDRARAVLVYVCASSRRFAIVGGEEVRRTAPQPFWELVDRDLQHHLAEGRYCDGIFKAIAQLALQLEHHFPPDPAENTEVRSAAAENPRANCDRPSGAESDGGRSPDLAGGEKGRWSTNVPARVPTSPSLSYPSTQSPTSSSLTPRPVRRLRRAASTRRRKRGSFSECVRMRDVARLAHLFLEASPRNQE